MLEVTPILAQTDGFNLVTLIGLGLHFAEGLFLFYLATAHSNRRDQLKSLDEKLEAAESKRANEVSAIARQLHEANVKLLDERDRRISHQILDQAQLVKSTNEAFKLRMERNEIAVEKLASVRMEAELSLVRALETTKNDIRECTPSREES